MKKISILSSVPAWVLKIISINPEYTNSEEISIAEMPFVLDQGILRSKSVLSEHQKQTEQTFDFKWKKRDTFESPNSLKRMKEWLYEKYGNPDHFSWLTQCKEPILLDAGCGAGMSGIEFWGNHLNKINYLGVDVSGAIDVAKDRFRKAELPGYFLQCDLMKLPFLDNSIDIIFSEGVLHHTDSTEKAIKQLSKFLKVGGRFLFYVYRKKGPIREFTDDYLRQKLKDMTENEAWDALMPLTKLGQILGDLNIEIEIPEAIQLLDIPAGKINIQRLIYWHVFKAFHHPELTLDEMNHINYDWFVPSNASRHTKQEIETWCSESNLVIERLVEEPAGFTVVAQKSDSCQSKHNPCHNQKSAH